VPGHADAPDEFSQVRYLRAKETVDDRALHRPTLDAVRRAATADDRDRLRVFEAGPGVGATLRRLLAWDLPPATTYLGVDTDETAVAAARERVPTLAREAGYDAVGGATPDDPARLTDGDRTVEVRFAAGDALARAPAERADLVVGAAFLDLFDVDRALSRLCAALVPGGLAYFPVTFDGATAFLPEEPGHDRVVDAFHATMDAPNRAGGSESGRALLRAVAASDASLVAAGGSDWLVAPPYPADEAYFLHHLVDVVERAVTRAESEAEPETARVPDSVAREWAGATHAAVARGAVTYLTHQLDALVRAPPSEA
jgi:SAM-dependent methyltransferase